MVTKHLRNSNTYAQILSVDFTVAFNTMQIFVHLQQLIDMGAWSRSLHWIRNFLTDRSQRICVKDIVSDEIVLNTGAPEGYVPSVMLVSL